MKFKQKKMKKKLNFQLFSTLDCECCPQKSTSKLSFCINHKIANFVLFFRGKFHFLKLSRLCCVCLGRSFWWLNELSEGVKHRKKNKWMNCMCIRDQAKCNKSRNIINYSRPQKNFTFFAESAENNFPSWVESFWVENKKKVGISRLARLFWCFLSFLLVSFFVFVQQLAERMEKKVIEFVRYFRRRFSLLFELRLAFGLEREKLSRWIFH